ncbi:MULTISPECIES: 23S rRNA (guanosine(2251)-2'-O)-methyltransferase RlmB [Thermodesulfovibrio]|uniref:RNA methyltransferase, TrmH family, group 3 n=1 Tax=Thermodesulfovibrio yellowstonii (strain ATCC 51303 / DSM 11347 / YP87) TaxID=289376 RepID=B5YID5_THEYD|nr:MULTISPECIES: 23S rRNA (guanosine(2251)-2'-O)-methyltransferase RlmB [Thermodesulfovibrio]ACI21569.1 RNA methyltransferase, TrmH family, group 3 [Thermodesulfovibrio yellowstonii DSM 11347]MDI6864512.1 23S rRNA (guanosine(2251)-2'-O)-methyltransferase RlmB [Thermodesulfovibrio yellowstonii]
MESKDKLMYIYGVNPVLESFKISDALKEIYISKNRISKLKEILRLAEEKSISVKIVEETFIEKITQGVHQGVVAKIKPKKTITLDEALKISFKKNEPAFFLILDLVEDPQNFGSICRIADAAGVHAIIYQKKRSVGIVPSVWKASAGAVWHVNLVEINNIKYAIKTLKEHNITIYGAEAQAKDVFWESDFTQPLGLIVGSEGKGIRQTVIALCDKVIKIPMRGTINSLNVSVASALITFEVLRQRKIQ